MYVIDNLLVQPLLYHMACTILVAWLKKNYCVCYILLPNPPVNQRVLEVGLITLWRLDVFSINAPMA